MTYEDIPSAYGARAEVLAGVLGREVAPDDPDREVIEAWAGGVPGRILDVGSGTGRWAGHLAALGHTVDGIEPSGPFVDMARESFPTVAFRHGAISDLDGTQERWAGLLAWYSLIHMDGQELPVALATLHRVLEAGGQLLLSFFTGPCHGPFAHPAATAYLWPMDCMVTALERAGFRVTGRRTQPGAPHAVVTARSAA
ncbi:class I SAM-dependent DNA methyltransferase [Dietzia cinnamea]|uniref:class I SAM-dependent DNA methyltransferase n=1 Tax=Dietzia cinnamea TaxID=321318 RepID=UPI00223ACF55|nr:class I SAM-dependent methyltransferase [Dietzia cinnamea]MCT1710626.1 class I SAM-dependent methyltransferase [Dietzia cinnamea]MCT2060531.1 class I SAM-dependent methyltransferase [Dietzia cinnamea]MCT2235899.1 class I SAM-dependent methyltransferase [Dietzia cinnamea]MCT2273007.1 class I SAM-dependent methyltransferase [Dietzia cinnamea]MCT2300050.1 class I SAM-dependent methyltransferase [Dietzia cinnamea]